LEVESDPQAADVDAMFDALVARYSDVDPVRAGIDRVAEIRAAMSALQAEELRELAALQARVSRSPVSGRQLEIANRSLVAELAVACRVSDRTMAARLADAEAMVAGFPATVQALADGAITLGHARVIAEHGAAVTDRALRARYESAVLTRAIEVTPGRLRRVAQLAAATLGEVSFDERHRLAREAHSVVVAELTDGMSQLVHTLPTVFAEAIRDRLTEQARAVALANADDPRTMDQLRSDLATELLLTGQPSGCGDAPHAAAVGIRAEVSIVIPALTLLGRDLPGRGEPGRGVEPATIAGRGPIGLDDAMLLAANVPSLIRIITDPLSDMVLAVDTYRPSEQLRRFLRIRDGRCRFPSCNRSPGRCDIDHTFDAHLGGPTEAGNLECLCRNHHTLKHHGGWKVKQESPGVLEWTGPHGIAVTDLPDAPVRFTG
jgi:hypothetical protein